MKASRVVFMSVVLIALVLLPIRAATAGLECPEFDGATSLIDFLDFDPEPAFGVLIDGDVAYLVERARGEPSRLVTLDVSDPVRPRRLGELEVPASGPPAIDGTTLYVPTDGSHFQLIDVADPLRPTLLRDVAMAMPVGGLAVIDGYLHVIGRDPIVGATTYVIDARDPRNLRSVRTIYLPAPWSDSTRESVVVRGDLMAASANREALLLHDVSDATRPHVLGSLAFEGYVADVHLVEGYAFVLVANSGLSVVDVKDPTAPIVVAHVPNEHVSWQLAVGDGLAVFGDGDHGTKFVDVSDPTRPRLLGELSALIAYGRPVVFGDRSWLPTYDNGIAVVDHGRFAAVPTTEVFASGAELGGMAGIDRSGDLLVVAARPGLGVYDARTGALLSTHGNDEHVQDVTLDKHIAYFAAGYDGLQIVDLSDPRRPRLLRTLRTVGQSGYVNAVSGVALVDGIAYVSTLYDNGGERGAYCYVVDVRSPAEPRVLERIPTPYARGVVAHRSAVHVAHGQITTIDASDPTAPRVVSVTSKLQPVRVLAVTDDALYAATGITPAGVFLYAFALDERRIPDQPTVRRVSDDVQSLLVHEDVLYVGTRGSGVEVFDVSVPTLPLPLGWISTSDPENAVWAQGLLASEGKLVVATDRAGILRAPLACGTGSIGPEEPTRPRKAPVLEVAPNPANPRTVVRLVDPVDGPVRVDVYDARGRRIVTLHDGPLENGDRDFVWNGVDDRGSLVASGVYHVDVTTVSGRTASRVLLVR